jgi:hypothetical protein
MKMLLLALAISASPLEQGKVWEKEINAYLLRRTSAR